MSEGTLLSFLSCNLQKDNSNTITQIFQNGLLQLLEAEGFTKPQIDACFGSDRVITVTKTANRKALGVMNDLMRIYDRLICDHGDFRTCDLWDIISKTNRIPQRTIGWDFSIELARQLATEKSA